MTKKCERADGAVCEMHQLVSDILRRAKEDVLRGHGLDALGLLESVFETIIKFPVLNVYKTGGNEKYSTKLTTSLWMLY